MFKNFDDTHGDFQDHRGEIDFPDYAETERLLLKSQQIPRNFVGYSIENLGQIPNPTFCSNHGNPYIFKPEPRWVADRYISAPVGIDLGKSHYSRNDCFPLIFYPTNGLPSLEVQMNFTRQFNSADIIINHCGEQALLKFYKNLVMHGIGNLDPLTGGYYYKSPIANIVTRVPLNNSNLHLIEGSDLDSGTIQNFVQLAVAPYSLRLYLQTFLPFPKKYNPEIRDYITTISDISIGKRVLHGMHVNLPLSENASLVFENQIKAKLGI
jgi:hypothetical protein